MKLLRAMHDKCMSLTQFTQTFSKMERLGGKLSAKEVIFLKYRCKPLSIYLKWIGDVHKGREVIYVKGKNDGKAVLHEYVGPLNVLMKADPNGAEARKRSRRPLTQAGIRNSADALYKLSEAAAKKHDMRLYYMGEEQVNGSPAHLLVRLLPKRPEYVVYLTLIYIDKKTLMPVKVVGYDWDYTLSWLYESRDIKPNVTLTDKDFDPKNSEYDYPGLIPLAWPFGGK